MRNRFRDPDKSASIKDELLTRSSAILLGEMKKSSTAYAASLVKCARNPTFGHWSTTLDK